MKETSILTPELQTKRDELLRIVREMQSVSVAFSGGVDSTVVAQAAYSALGDNAEAVTADSPSVARAELDDALKLAKCIGIRHRIIRTSEFENSRYQENSGDRCFFCKDELYGRIHDSLKSPSIVCSGANVDDLGDYRPGLKAAADHGVRHPLQEAGFTKADVRALAKAWELPTWDKPASPCLSSRIAPGVQVTVERTARVEHAEQLLKSLGFGELRVRLHEGELARIEVPLASFERLLAGDVRERIVNRFKEWGFRFVTFDLEGFRSGNLNSLIPAETIQLFARSEQGNKT